MGNYSRNHSVVNQPFHVEVSHVGSRLEKQKEESETLRILQVTPFYSSSLESGGVARASYEISRRLPVLGHEVTVITTNRSIYETGVVTNKKIRSDQTDVYYLDNLRRLAPGVLFPPIPYSSPLILPMEVRTHDIVHVHDYRNLLTFFAYTSARGQKKPFLIQCHGSSLPFFRHTSLKRVFDILTGRRILRDASLAIALSENEASQYRMMGVDQSRIRVIPNGVDLDEFRSLPERGCFRSRYNISDETKVVLYLGRISPIKGLDLLIRSFALLTRMIPDSKLVIVGPDAGSLSELRHLSSKMGISHKILFPGPLFGVDKLEVLADADVFVLPSVHEMFPISVLEAWACRVPVIVTSNCGIADVVKYAGLVVNRNERELYSAMERMLSEDSLRMESMRTGVNLVRERYNWNRIVGQIVTAYQEIAHNATE